MKERSLTARPEEFGQGCRYNTKGVLCPAHGDDDCKKCGWNPSVWAARVFALRKVFYAKVERTMKVGF